MASHNATSLGAQPTVSYPPLEDRPIKNTICLFDVDGTLSPARLVSFSPLAARRSPPADGLPLLSVWPSAR